MSLIGSDLVFLEKVKSRVDKTIKFIFLSRGQVVEFSYINKDDGKDIICVPTQTACNLGCKFCFLSDYDLEVRNLSPEEILIPIDYVVHDLELLTRRDCNKILLVSWMGCGEPLRNINNVIESCNLIRDEYKDDYQIVRFGLASLIPKIKLMQEFTEAVKIHRLPLKFHLSLHSPDTKMRKEIMPSAGSIMESIILVEFFMHRTANSAEIHYAMIEGVNDREEDLTALIKALKGRNIPVKFLAYNEKPSVDFKESTKVKHFRDALEAEGIATEFYNPPGADIGSSCGQFLMDYYEKYNKKTKSGKLNQ